MRTKESFFISESRIAIEIAEPSCGSVPLPSSSKSTSEEESAYFTAFEIFFM